MLVPALLNAQTGFGVVNISVCNLRDTPRYSAEMVSQGLLGTPVHILRHGGDYGWPEVMTPEGYTGWVHKDAITEMSEKDYRAWNASEKVVVTALFSIVRETPSPRGAVLSDVVGGDRLKLHFRSRGFWKVEFPDGRTGYIPGRDAEPESSWRARVSHDAPDVLATALSMNGFPYLWAGMSPKGMDCSGYVRAVLWMHDIIIPRDASEQALVGESIYGRENLIPGDLVFFGRMDGDTPRVSHVGFYLGDERFIHCLGLVKIASFDPESPEYDAYNTGRYLFGGRVLPYLNARPGITTSAENGFYSQK